MTDPVENFEFILKKQSSKRGLGLYSDNKQHNKHTLKPQDVISSVSIQLKAIQVADTSKSEKYLCKDLQKLQKYKKDSFLSVNKLPVYEEVPKQATNFDTQCVSDTQLINVIEDAEIIDVHRGMTQEFETSFCYYTEKQHIDAEKTDRDVHIVDNVKVTKDIQSIYDKERAKNIHLENNDTLSSKYIQTVNKESMNKIHENITEAISDSLMVNSMENNIGTDNSLSMSSPIMCNNNILDKETGLYSQNSKKDECTQVEDLPQMFNEHIEIEDEADVVIERPLSPIFMHKHVKTISKTPPPLIFNLNKFENFEQIAIPILEANDLKTAKQVINSQILDKELHIKIDDEIFLNERGVLSPVLQNKNYKSDPVVENNEEFKTHIDPNSDTDLEFIELDKATTDDLINKVMNGNPEGDLKVRAESEILKDEILFSSDEEDNYVHKSYQDLPFTCALETSFYDQSDVLDKTMYVGFQTASNKTIQIFTESFAQAQSILSNVTSEEVTVTDLVKNCENHANNKIQDVDETQVKMDTDSGIKEFNLDQKEDKESELGFSIRKTVEEPKDLPHDEIEIINFEGFMTASKKEIKLSQKALARSKKVFQDIDLNEHFDTEIEEENVQSRVESCEDNIPFIPDISKTEVNKSYADDDLQNIDDAIIQEFENIEMSLEEDKLTNKNVASFGLKTASNKAIQISETALTIIKDVFNDIDFDEDLNEVDSREINKEETTLPKVTEDLKIENIISDTNLAGSKTASNINIDISKEALAKTTNIFQSIDSTEFPNKSSNSLDKVNQNIIDFDQLSTSKAGFGGFITANNKNIKISNQALAKSRNVFKDIDSTAFEYPKKKGKDLHENDSEENICDCPSTSKTSSVGLRTANNRDINISTEDLAETKKIFENIDSAGYELSNKDSKDENTCRANEGFREFHQPSTSKTSFVGFKTANNNKIKISAAALAKTKNIFKHIDTTGSKCPEEGSNDAQNLEQKNKLQDENIVEAETETFVLPTIFTTTKLSFTGFKTANNRNIKISETALAKTMNIFKDIDSDEITFPSKVNKELQENIEEIIKAVDDNEYTCEVEPIDFNKLSTSTATFAGFKTANNKKINISEAALSKTKQIFKDIGDKDFKFPEKCIKGLNTIESAVEEKKIDEQKITYKSKYLNQGFAGFKTANNRKINISEESLAKTRNIFKDIDATDFKLSEKANIDSGRNNREGDSKSTSVSETTDWNQLSTSKASFVGFKTANNKKISISEESLAKTKNIFKDIDSNDLIVLETENRELRGTGTDRKSAYPDFTDPIQPSTSTTSFVGFKTGNNKVINVSEIALVKTKNVFKDIDSIELEIPKKLKDDYPIIENEIDKTESGLISKDRKATDVKITTNNDFEMPATTGYKFQGFQTASNKQVRVSADALVKSKKILQDINVSEDFNIESKKIEANIVLCTENKILKTGNDSVHINNRTVDNIEDPNIDDLHLDGKSSPVFKGFQTGNKKPVNVSKEALAKSRKLFQDIDRIPDEDDPEPEFFGFKMVNDRAVGVPEKDMTETRKVFEDVINENSSFKGFQTASNQKVVISEDSLAKCRKIFQDIEKHEKNEESFKNNEKKTSSIKFGFKTGTDRAIVVSEEAVARSKRLFSEIDDSNEATRNKKDKISEENIANIIDTQVLNNFDESLHTDDFHDSPVKSKRSGSPILSCPRAKRRKKFETPYSQKLPKQENKIEIIDYKVKNKISFNENYKKNKKYTLKDLTKISKNNTTLIDPYILQFTFDNLLQFKFHDSRNGLSYGNMTIDLLKELFLNSVNSKLIPNGWLDNHLKLILWKLISYEIKFKSTVVCGAKNVIDQLKYRYDKELYNAQRPALRRILEKDDVASKTIVLCVAAIYVDGVNAASTTTTNNVELSLTDGWYCIRASIDKMLAQLVCQCKINVGTKIVTNGAELVNCEQGISPWEDTSAVRLKIFGNSTRRARWDARLGYHGNGAILSQLSSVKLDGGKVSKLRMFVTRVYPALYVEKFEDGSTVTRSERLEHLHQMKSEAERQVAMEKIYEEVEREFSDQESQDSESLSDVSNKRTCFDSGSQIAKVMKISKDPAEFRAGLTSSQSRLLEDYSSKRREVLLQDIKQRIRDKIEKAGVCVNRNVVTLLKIRVAGVRERSGVEVTKGMMSIWKPTDAVLEIIKEGAWIDVMNVVPTAVRYSEIQISAGRQSVFSISKYKEPENFNPYTKLLKRTCFTIKDLAQNPAMITDYNEIDTVGFIFLIDPSVHEFDSTKQPFQNIFLADTDKNMICINFWGGLKKFGFQNVLDIGQTVACVNLQKRAGNTRKSIPQYRVTEFSYFTKSPKNENTRNFIDNLNKNFLSLDRRKFCDECVVLKNNCSVIKYNNENMSPYCRFNNSEYNMSKNKMFIDSPLIRTNKIDDNFSLTGLDFESTFKQTDTQNLSEEVLLRKKKVNEKIARLKMYGEPPPLSTIHIINRSKNASSSYKSPLTSDNSKNIPHRPRSEKAVNSKFDSSINVASVEETPEKCANPNESDVACSPVLMNRTYVKSVNPVKINFDLKDTNDSNVDHFAEEFDGSPPLSLD